MPRTIQESYQELYDRSAAPWGDTTSRGDAGALVDAHAFARIVEAGHRLSQEPEEKLLWFGVNEKGRLLVEGQLAGTAHEVFIDVGRLVREAQSWKPKGLKAVILLHNHPTRRVDGPREYGRIMEPSADDRHATQVLQESLGGVGIELLDHLIVCPKGLPYSFAESGALAGAQGGEGR